MPSCQSRRPQVSNLVRCLACKIHAPLQVYTFDLEVRDDVWRGRKMTRLRVTVDGNELYECLGFFQSFVFQAAQIRARRASEGIGCCTGAIRFSLTCASG